MKLFSKAVALFASLVATANGDGTDFKEPLISVPDSDSTVLLLLLALALLALTVIAPRLRRRLRNSK